MSRQRITAYVLHTTKHKVAKMYNIIALTLQNTHGNAAFLPLGKCLLTTSHPINRHRFPFSHLDSSSMCPKEAANHTASRLHAFENRNLSILCPLSPLTPSPYLHLHLSATDSDAHAPPQTNPPGYMFSGLMLHRVT